MCVCVHWSYIAGGGLLSFYKGRRGKRSWFRGLDRIFFFFFFFFFVRIVVGYLSKILEELCVAAGMSIKYNGNIADRIENILEDKNV